MRVGRFFHWCQLRMKWVEGLEMELMLFQLKSSSRAHRPDTKKPRKNAAFLFGGPTRT